VRCDVKTYMYTFKLLTDIDMVMFIERGGLNQYSNTRKQQVCAVVRYNETIVVPYADFWWVDDVENFDIISITSDSTFSRWIWSIHKNLHNAYADLPLCPTRDKPLNKRQDILLATLCDKTRYIIHYCNLQLCVRHGLRLTKIHRILQFAQSR